ENETESTDAKPEASSSTTDTSAADKAAADKAAADKAAADKAAADQAALAAQVAAAAAAKPYVWEYQGEKFTQQEYDLLREVFDHTEGFDVNVSHHTVNDLISICVQNGLR
ncbi:MAG TPA: hypothetical protein VJZ01_12550, partial [Lachnospiraceae bacterium]|nr:hypothetical protein [Lachnospiraceae bacterium]